MLAAIRVWAGILLSHGGIGVGIWCLGMGYGGDVKGWEWGVQIQDYGCRQNYSYPSTNMPDNNSKGNVENDGATKLFYVQI